jgi:hypothetical protein
MAPGPDTTIFPFDAADKAEPSRLNALEREKWAYPATPDETRDTTDLRRSVFSPLRCPQTRRHEATRPDVRPAAFVLGRRNLNRTRLTF